MTENTTRERDSTLKSRTFFLDTLAFFLILFTPYLGFIIYSNILFEKSNIIIISGFIIISVCLAAILLFVNSIALRVLFISVLLIMFIDLQFSLLQWSGAVVIAVVVAVPVSSWILRGHLSRIVSVTFGTIIVATSVAPLLQSSSESGQGQTNQVGDADTSLPIYIHLILDEHIGTGGLEGVVPQQVTLKHEIDSFLSEFGFRTFDRSYSQYYDTFDSVTATLNVNQTDGVHAQTSEERVDLMRPYFDHLASKGYNIIVYQVVTGLDFCSSTRKNLKKCFNYHNYGLSSRALAEMSVVEKTMVTVSVYRHLSVFVAFAELLYNDLRDDIGAGGLDLRVWKSMVSPLGALLMFDQLIEDVSNASRGTAFFAHLLIPHYPYILDSACGLRRPIMTWQVKMAESPEHRALLYAEYGEQVRCTKLKLVALMDALKKRGMFDDATIILHGDHGSRIVLVEPRAPNKTLLSRQDYVDGFSTLFAVKSTQVEPGYDHRMLPLSKLLRDTVDGDLMVPTTPGHGETPTVFLRDSGSGIYEKVRMPEFGATKRQGTVTNQRDAVGPR